MDKELIKWSEGYSVGIDEIDNQHRKLIGLINRLYNLYLEKKSNEISPVIKDIKDYTIYHFSTEEKLFKEKNYKHTSEHTLMHGRFIDELNELNKTFGNLPGVLTMKTMTFLQRWLTNHIMKEDKKYMGYLD